MSKKQGELKARMKSYETYYKYYMMPEMNEAIVIRLDGKNCSKWTKNFEKPFDELFNDCMKATLEYLVNNVPNCVCGSTHSDEISLIIHLDNPESEYWFGGAVEKIVSVSASMATMAFNREFYTLAWSDETICRFNSEVNCAHFEAANKGLIFDSRAFIIPLYDVPNYFIDRQRDCIRNSVEGLARMSFTHNELHCKNTGQMVDMLKEKGIDWNKQSNDYRLGTIAYKISIPIGPESYRHSWMLMKTTPVLNYYNQDFIMEDFYGKIVQKESVL